METLHNIIDNLQDFLWTYINIGLLIGCAIYFTVRTRFIQFRLLGDMVRQMFSSGKSAGSHGGDGQAENGKKPISSFQAFIVALASRIGTGNLAGVATAISVGGPGAIFWMWVMALFGAATAFVESTLAQLYKRKGKRSYHGGPAYYMRHGLHRKWMGILFSI
ncbi:MAG: alanine:cation symporter family protein, partial [Bacteroidales bacterium]|nr:alanine:cation symporter family protein [Bacteroidales bacterium]